MVNDDESVSILTDLGLTVLQAKIYLALVTRESSTAKNISDISRVSRPDVYRVISELEILGLIERIIGKPTRYQAAPLEICTHILVQNMINKFMETRRKIPVLLKKIGELTLEKSEESKNEFSIIPKELFLTKSKKLIANSKKSFYAVVSTEKVVYSPDEYTKIFKAATARNVDCKLVACYPKNEKLREILCNYATEDKNFQVRFVKDPPILAIGIFDGESVLLNTKPRENFDSSAFLSYNKGVVLLCEFYFDRLWNEGFC